MNFFLVLADPACPRNGLLLILVSCLSLTLIQTRNNGSCLQQGNQNDFKSNEKILILYQAKR